MKNDEVWSLTPKGYEEARKVALKHPELMPYHYVLHIDWDYPWPAQWVKIWQKHVINLIEANYGMFVERIIIKPSPSREGGSHIWIHFSTLGLLSDDKINLLQWLCLDHHTRVWINVLRTDRGLKKFWSKLFSKHLWKKPLPKRCQKCKLREILNEMREQHGTKQANTP